MVASTEMRVFSLAPDPVFLKRKAPLRLRLDPTLSVPRSSICTRPASNTRLSPSARVTKFSATSSGTV